MVNTIQTSLSGLIASTKNLDATSSNIANADTVGSLTDPDNAPYNALQTRQTSENGGVNAEFVTKDPPFVPSYAPNSPFADENGLIGAPNVNLTEELVISKEAEFAYKANAFTLKTGIEMQETLLNAIDKDA
jgi:flagellar basal-body rod protein FlgC